MLHLKINYYIKKLFETRALMFRVFLYLPLPVEADFQEILDSDEGEKMLKGNLFAIR